MAPRSGNDVCHVPEPASQTPEPERPPQDRRRNWLEAELDYTAEQAETEASRCLASVTCVYCEVCQLVCPDLCITRDEATGVVQFDLEYCKGCGLCAYYCPKGAIEMVREVE